MDLKKELRCKKCESTMTYLRKDKNHKGRFERFCRHCGHVEELKMKVDQ